MEIPQDPASAGGATPQAVAISPGHTHNMAFQSNATSESALITSSTFTSTAAVESPSRLLGLPAELRVQIYEYLVVVGKVFYKPDYCKMEQNSVRFKDWEKYQVPSLHIFRVCKQIQQEAEAMYFAKNMFVLPVLFKVLRPFKGREEMSDDVLHPTGRGRALFSSNALHSTKNIAITYCNRGPVPLTMAASDWDERETDGESPFDDLTENERRDVAHKQALEYLCHHWMGVHRALGRITSKIEHLEIDFSNAFCPSGCCRNLDMDLFSVCRLAPKTIRLLGLRTREVNLIKTELEADHGISQKELARKFHFELGPHEDKWAKWTVE